LGKRHNRSEASGGGTQSAWRKPERLEIKTALVATHYTRN